jgi:hypothetical protein
MTEGEIIKLVDDGAKLDIEIDAKTKELKKIKALLVTLDAGDYFGDSGRIAKVIHPAPKIAPAATQIEPLREAIGDADFKTLFDRIVTWKPVKECRSVAVRILSPGQLKKFLSFCEQDSSPYVIFT